MNCREIEALLPAYVDEELDLVHSLEVEAHLQECRACASRVQQQRTVRHLVSEHAPYFTAPAELRQRLERQVAAHFGAPERSSPSGVRWLALAAAAMLAVAVLWRVTPLPVQPGSAGIESQVVAGHVRSLLANHLMDIPSSDRHTVKPWFTGKLNFAPDVQDLAAQGFALTGGRLDYIDGRTVAALVYERRKHTVNLFTWPAESGDRAIERGARDGFNVVHWMHGGMNWWAVSDLNGDELAQMARLLGGR